MEPAELPADFKEFLKLLNENAVEYLVVGGFAVGDHGYPRATDDLDVWVRLDRCNAKRLVLSLRQFGFDAPNLSEDLFLQEDKIVRMGDSPLRIEIMTSIDGVEFAECFRTREVVDLDGVETNVISLDNLKQNKRASGRHKDLADP